ncbi:protein MNN4-like isoform X1 [Durio zibethinus]|uniref:Protein MNN4-like isoform X1 n=1 Tax=Durio zibethinus TaxID=66656 RepID=A0A6P5WFU6_DURZI|nr:protein MNN4-like isoform X1 [Durio zibethinus]
MFRTKNACSRFLTHFNLLRTRPFCSTIKDCKNNKNNNKDNVNGKIESNVSTYNESYRQLENLDFMTAAKILFTHPPKKKKFGIDFHLVQLFFACMPSLAVYLVAQYARYEMRKMEVELEEKKKQEEEEAKRKQEEDKKKQEEEETAKQMEQIATDPELLEVKVRLGKLEEAVKEIVVESKKQSAGSISKSQQNASETGEDKSKSSMEQDKVTKQKSIEQTPNVDRGKVRTVASASDASQKDPKGENEIGGPSQDAKR